MRELGNMREQIKAVNKLKAHQQDDALERFSKRFDDPEKPTFVWQLDFAEVFHRNSAVSTTADFTDGSGSIDKPKRGFEIVVANCHMGLFFDEEQKAFLEDRFPTFRRNDSTIRCFYPTWSRATRTKRRARLHLTPNTFLLGPYFDSLKRYILEEARVRQIIDFGTNQVFADPNVFTALLFLHKNGGGNETVSNEVAIRENFRDPCVPRQFAALVPSPLKQSVAMRWMPGNPLLLRLTKSAGKIDDVAEGRWTELLGLKVEERREEVQSPTAFWTKVSGGTREISLI